MFGKKKAENEVSPQPSIPPQPAPLPPAPDHAPVAPPPTSGDAEASVPQAPLPPAPEASEATPAAETFDEKMNTSVPVIAQTHAPQGGPERGLVDANSASAAPPTPQDSIATASYRNLSLETESFIQAKQQLLEQLIDQVDFIALGKLEKEVQRNRISDVMTRLLEKVEIPLSSGQVSVLKEQLIDELFGFGPLEPLLQDPDISDIMVNSSKQVYVEKAGKIVQTDVTFYDEQHLLGIIQRIVSRVGRRVDESSPMVDARMPDGSRFNAIIPPLALDGSLVSIRKFKKNKMPLEKYVDYSSMTPEMAKFLGICGYIGLNIIVSGGTGSGKTTLLNALSGGIGYDERIITIEDAAELQLQQPHILRLETRPASMEGRGEITQRQLVKNALRMRPDRIILGEIRGDEVIDVLSAMNTGHDGSMATIHANNPRDCLARIENLVGMSGVAIGTSSLRKQIASAVQLIVQIERQRDGKRRITSIEEVVGLEGDIITTQTIFSFKQRGIDEHGNLLGEFINHGIRPKMIERASFYGKEQDVLDCLKGAM